jgi:hypothetical protein
MIINNKKTRFNYNNRLKNRSENKLIFKVQTACNQFKNDYIIMGY